MLLGFTAEASLSPRRQHYPGIRREHTAKESIYPSMPSQTCFGKCFETWEGGCDGFPIGRPRYDCYSAGMKACTDLCAPNPWSTP
jgi:hypothetical protein